MDWSKILKEITAFSSFRPGQEEALTALSEQKNTLALLPTGGGKTLIYKLFGYVIQKPVVIISPLIALMEDQANQLRLEGEKKVLTLNSALDFQSRREALSHLYDYKFIFLSPEMLWQPKVFQQVKALDLGLLVVDEAHCISEWGFDFRIEYTELLPMRQKLGHPLTLALSATADQQVVKDIQTYLFSKEEEMLTIRTTLNRPNLFFAFNEVKESDKPALLLHWLNQLPKPGIVYVHYKKEIEALKQWLSEHSTLKIESYHADRSSEDRHIIQEQFRHHELDAILCTSAFGMGINQPDVRFVLHYHLPSSLSNLSQEMGRAGRDGKQALALVLYSQEDLDRRGLQQQENNDEVLRILKASYDSPQTLKDKFDYLDETTQNLVLFYQRHFNLYQKAMAHFNQLEQRQSYKGRTLLQLFSSKRCIRSQLLEAFGEKLEEEPEFCCSRTNPNFIDSEAFKAYLTLAPTKVKDQKTTLDWRKKWEALFVTKGTDNF